MNKHKKMSRMLIFAIVAACMVAVLLVAAVVLIYIEKNSLSGTWVYDEYTRYIFEKDGSGRLEVDDVRYGYIYQAAGDRLTLDFTEDVVRDCEYTFSIKNGAMTLIGGKNTDGKTYHLTKK